MIYYEFLKFGLFSRIYKSFSIYFNSRKGLLRQHDVMLTSAGQQDGPGQTDKWVPHVSAISFAKKIIRTKPD